MRVTKHFFLRLEKLNTNVTLMKCFCIYKFHVNNFELEHFIKMGNKQ